jgi:hypothetical protein
VVGRRWLGIAGAWLLVIGFTWGFVALPEHCGDLTEAEAREAAEATVAWFDRNQLDDGRWVYRYNIDTGATDHNPHTVRHAGVTMSLYQAHEAGIDGALGIADAGADWALGPDVVVHQDDLAMMSPTRYAPTGGAALLAAGLAQRYRAEGPSHYDDDMWALGRFLVAVTEDDGAVLASWDTRQGAPVPDHYSLFFTGEAYFALALLAEIDPEGRHGDWAGTADLIGHYLATERDEAENLFPPTSDHWAAYGLGASADAGIPLDDDQVAYGERLAEIFSIQIRYESQRTNEGLNRYVQRGPEALGAGVGTLGEGLGALWTLTDDGGPLEDHRAAIGERLRCTAGVLHDRQIDAEEAAGTLDPGLTEGAWFRLGWTQKDDQQHALSALLLAEEALAEGDGSSSPTGDDSVAHVLWLMVIAVALANPVRARRLRATDDGATAPARLAVGMAVTALALAAAAAVGGPLLEAIDVSAPTAMIGAGLVVALTGMVDFFRPTGESVPAGKGVAAWLVPLVVPGLLRPALAVFALAVGAHVGIGAGVAVAIVTGLTGLAAWRPAPEGEPSPLEKYVAQALAVLVVIGGVAAAADGIFSI